MVTDRSHRTFISYSRANKDFAMKLARELRTAGFDIWFDLLDIPTGARWDDEVERALDECDIFMVVLTSASSKSDNVKDEISFAIDTKKRILPVLLENATLPLRLRRFQYVDFTLKSYEEGVESAKHLLSNLVEQSPIAGTEFPTATQILGEHKTEESDGLLRQKIKDKRSASISSAVEPAPKSQSIVTEKKSLSEGLIIGIVVITLSIVAAVAFTISGRINIGKLFSEPTLVSVPAPTILDASEARKLIESDEGVGIYSTAREQYTIDELDSFGENSQPIPIRLENPTPIIVGYNDAWCAATQDILRDNFAYIKILFKFDDKVASENNYVDDYYTNADGLECFSRRIVISGWISGAYFISQEISLTQKINDGLDDQDPFTDSMSYIVTVP